MIKERSRRRFSGQGLVEFALILPVLLLIILGIFEFGRILLIYSGLFNAAREGARYGITNPRDYSGIRTEATSRMVLVTQDDPDLDLQVRYDSGPGSSVHSDYQSVTPGDRVLVDVRYPIRPMTALFTPLVGSLSLDTQAVRTIQSVGTLVSAPPGEGPVPPGEGPGEGEELLASPELEINPTCGPSGSQTIAVSGSGWTGDNRVDVYFGAGKELNNQSINDDGSFTLSISVTPADGTHAVAVEGRQSGARLSTSYTVPCPTEPPPPAGIAIDVPVTAGDAEITGSADPGETVTLAVDGNTLGQAVVDVAGRFTFDGLATSDLQAGTTVVVSGYGESDTTTVVPAPILTPIAIDIPVMSGDREITGSAEPGRQAELFVDGASQGTTTVSDLGRFGFSGLSALQAGATVLVRGVDTYTSEDSTLVEAIVARSPITITQPVYANSTSVTGWAEPNFAVTLRIIQTGLRRTVTVGADGSFSFSDLTSLVAGHTVVVEGYGEQDSAVIETDPADAYVYIDETCLDPGNRTFTAHGRNIPRNKSYGSIRVYWNEQRVATRSYKYQDQAFDESITQSVTEPGPHTIRVDILEKVRNTWTVVLSMPPISIPVCETTPAATLPDLVVTNLSIKDDPLPGTYERLNLNVAIRNAGDTHVTSLFWVDLFADHDPDTPLPDQPSVDYVAVNALSAGSTITFTMYVPDGFSETGPHTLVAMVDTWNQVPELLEDNNVSAVETLTITVQNPQPEPTPVAEGPTGTLTGEAYVEGEPTAGVSIYLYAQDGRLAASGRSVNDGLFGFTDLPTGQYTLVGEYREADTYAIDSQIITISENTTLPTELQLTAMEGTTP